nr:hypothetical protein [Tanacetum cinerariifolium]
LANTPFYLLYGGVGGVAVVVLVTRVWSVMNGGGGSGGERRVRESGVEGWIDRVTSNLSGFAGKIPAEKFFGGGRRRRVVVARWAAAGGVGRVLFLCVCILRKK